MTARLTADEIIALLRSSPENYSTKEQLGELARQVDANTPGGLTVLYRINRVPCGLPLVRGCHLGQAVWMEQLFTHALGLSPPWAVVSVDFRQPQGASTLPCSASAALALSGLRGSGAADPRSHRASLATPALLPVQGFHPCATAACGVHGVWQDPPGAAAVGASRLGLFVGAGGFRDRAAPGDAGSACGAAGRRVR